MSKSSILRLFRAISSLESLEPRLLFSTYDIQGVQAAALDQPQVYAIFRDSPTGNPLGGTGPDDGYAVKAFLDTGASGVLISQESAASDALNLTQATFNGQPIEFTDIGVAGGEAFDVSTAVYGELAPVTTIGEEDLPVDAFDQSFGPVRTQINQTPADFLTGELNVMGMPTLQGKVAVMDPTPLNATDISQLDGMHTYIYSPGTAYRPATKTTDPGIPNVNRHVQLSYANFSKYTTTTPAGAQGPTLAANPFIGPNPVRAAGTVDNTPMIHLTEGTKSANGSFLLDTGAAASFISQNIAGQLGVHYKPGTYGMDNAQLLDANGNVVPNQFSIPIGGIGGTVNAVGFFADSLTLPTTEGEGIRFLQAPVLVLDVTVEDPATHVQTTLDGDFGMNYLVASIAVDGSTLGDGAAGAFDWVTFDQPNGILGLDLPDLPPGPPPSPPPPITTATIGGKVYKDLAANGVLDGADIGIGGRTVYIDKDASNSLTAGDVSTTTASDGSYSFSNLPAGKPYTVRQVVPSGWKASGATSYSVTPAAGATVSGKNFGTYQQATIKGTLFFDANANGTRDSTETALSGWTVWLDLNGNGTKDTTDKSTTTDSSGNYTFSGLDLKSFTARVVVQSGYRQSTPSGGKRVTASLTSGQVLSSQNFGLTKRASISGVVFTDANKSGVKDTGETGLSGWKVYIDANGNGKWDSTERFILSAATTGAWSFNDLLSGKNYVIRIAPQTGYTRSAPTSGSFSYTPTSGQVQSNKNFGEHK